MFTRFNRRSGARLLGGLLVLAGLAVSAQAQEFQALDDPAQIDENADAVQRTSNSLCWELHKFHRQQPGFPETYRQAKELWSMAGTLRDALRSGAIDPATLNDQVLRMNDALTAVEKSTASWGNGVRPPLSATPPDQPVVVEKRGVNVDIPLLFGGGISVGTPSRVVVPDPAVLPTLPRQRFHPNARGSRRSLERELFAVRTALNYLAEDTGVLPTQAGPAPVAPPKPMPPDTTSGPELAPPTKIVPSAKQTGGDATKK